MSQRSLNKIMNFKSNLTSNQKKDSKFKFKKLKKNLELKSLNLRKDLNKLC